jgi:hypothetical protein
MDSGKSIQIEQGNFVRTRAEMFERLAATPLSGGVIRCLLFLLRKTYGFIKKEKRISLALRRKIIFVRASEGTQASTWGLNKYYEQWITDPGSEAAAAASYPCVDGDGCAAPALELAAPPSVLGEEYSHTPTVIHIDDSTVIGEEYSKKPAVLNLDDRTVISPHERTTDKQTKAAAAAALLAQVRARTETDPGCAGFVRASERIRGFGVQVPEVGEKIQRGRRRLSPALCEVVLSEGLEHNRRTGRDRRPLLEQVEPEGLAVLRPRVNGRAEEWSGLTSAIKADRASFAGRRCAGCDGFAFQRVKDMHDGRSGPR